MQERRQNVRVRPSADYDICIQLQKDLLTVRLSIIDLAVGGIGVMLDQLFVDLPLNSALELNISLPDTAEFKTQAYLRHSTGKIGGRCGFHFADLTDDQQKAWARAVSELLERGCSV